MYKLKDKLKTAGIYILFSIVIVILGFPIYWLIITSFKMPIEWATNPPIFWPSNFYLKSYAWAINDPEVRKALINTVITAIFTTLIAGFFGAISAYSLAKIKFKYNFNRILLIWILLTRMIPPVAMLLPYFIIIRNLGLLDTRLALVLTYTYLSFPFVVWMMLGFFKEMPREIDEAAIIDGCNFWDRFIKIGLPLARTGLVVVSIFVFIFAWNEFLFAITLTSLKAQTLPVLMGSFINDKGYEWGKMMVLSVISTIPVLLFAIGTQKYLIKGLTFGAVKE